MLDNTFYFEAFNDLSTTRQVAMGMGPIPIDKIGWYADCFELDPLESEAFEYILRRVDVAYLNLQADKAAKRAKRSK